VRGRAALHSPSTAIVDFRQVARAMADDLRASGGRLLLNHQVTRIEPEAGRVAVYAAGERYLVDRLVICAGLQSDQVARLAGDDAAPAIVPFRGEYYRLAPNRADLVRGLVYPVPDPAYPFLGVHITPRVDGAVDVGPNAVFALAREGYRRRDVNVSELWHALAWPGTRRLFLRHWRMGLREMRGSLSRRAFASIVRDYVPEIAASDLLRAPAGVRAQAVDPDGSLVEDFRVSTIGPIIAVRNAPSPAATSSLAIAEYVVDHLPDL
jgi:L-2-hydroxyglutarate oxidase LhgO